jgi:Trk K+ transport system NAD-binding subunit
VVGFFRDGRLEFPAPDTVWQTVDEILILTRGTSPVEIDALFSAT